MAAPTLGTPGIFKIGKISIEKLQPRIQGTSKIKNVLSNSIAGGVFNILETRFSYSWLLYTSHSMELNECIEDKCERRSKNILER